MEVLELQHELPVGVVGIRRQDVRTPAGGTAVKTAAHDLARLRVTPGRTRGFDQQTRVQAHLLMGGGPEVVVGEYRAYGAVLSLGV